MPTTRNRPNASVSAPLRLQKLLDYLIEANPRGLMKVLYSHGALPYGYNESIRKYLTKNALIVIREEGDQGIGALLAAHPDKDLILDTFGSGLDLESSLEPSNKSSREDLAESNYSGPLESLTGLTRGEKAIGVLSVTLILVAVLYLLTDK